MSNASVIISGDLEYKCRIINPVEYTNEFEMFVRDTFFKYEPMNTHLGSYPDYIHLDWFRQQLKRAKSDNVSLGIYINETLIAYAINHVEHIDQNEPNDDNTNSTLILNETMRKYHEIYLLIDKLHVDLNLYSMFNVKSLFHILLIGVQPQYRQLKLANKLILESIKLAQKINFEVIYAEATGIYSLNAFLKQGFMNVKTIEYESYENERGEKTFSGIQTHKGCSIVVKDLREQI